MSLVGIDSGSIITFTNTGSAISSGDLVHIGAGLVGIAQTDIAATSGVGAVMITGRHTVTKGTPASAYPIGRLLKVGTAGNTVDLATASSTASAICTARVAKASITGATTVEVILVP